MPHLSWDSKGKTSPISASVKLDSVVYPGGKGYPGDEPEDHLIWGDNLAVMHTLLPEYEGRIRLIYADPPFFTNRRYAARVGRGEDSRRPQEWQLAEGYPDHWPDLEAYLDMLYPRLLLMQRLLADDGTLYLHLDWHANSYARILLDEIFGPDRLLNEIVWIYHGPSPIRSAFNRKHDTILAYTKSADYVFNVDDIRVPYDPSTVKTFESSTKAGFGKVPDLDRGKVPEDWWYFPVIARLHKERTGYPTQKPEALLERIVLASSNPGDIVADFFCGSGTTAAVAARFGRRIVASDVTWRALHTTRNRLVKQHTKPFTLHEVQLLNTKSEKPSPFYDVIDAGSTFFDVDLNYSAADRSSKNVRVSINEPSILSNLDYWEIDPAWDGKVFRSVAQAVRPRKQGDISNTLVFARPNHRIKLCARLVNIDGQRAQYKI